ncbi:MAG: efflux transporter outer membrane subunit [Alphaproteobacteria bacterium]|nr:efflux transporter outer membrane subunit [Alphaproteobacteria bacterium]
MRPLIAIAALAAVLAACTSPKGPQDSGIEPPAAWGGLADAPPGPLVPSDQAEIEQRWWRSFSDPVLDRLIAAALAGNKSLQIAAARVEEARAARRGAVANLYPDVAVTADATRSNQGLLTSNRPVSIKEADLQASWEADLFGKNQARAAEAAAIVQSADARRQAVMVALLAEVARAYFDLRNYEEQIAITGRNLATQQRTLELVKQQQAGALASSLDVARQAAQAATTSAQIPALRAAYKVSAHRLAVLLGSPPQAIEPWLTPDVRLAPLPPAVLVAAPARVLANRPDVRAAERDFAASISASDSAAREIYPTISLTAFFGIQDSTVFNATPWGIGASLAQPLLNFGRIQSDIDVADARQKQAFLSYQETTLEALQDMEDALSLYLNENGRERELAAAAEQNRKSVELAEQQYKAGYSGLLDLLDAQRNELAAESSLATSDFALRQQLVRIYSAAGGGWQL